MKYTSRTHVLFAICAFLIAYVGYILFANFKTEIERKQLLSELFTTEARHIKNQTDFIMAVYRKMIEDLSSDRRIVAYFLNKRMGMSEAYGLWVSEMEAIKALAERQCYSHPTFTCFNTVILTDNAKKILAYAGSSEVLENIHPNDFFQKESFPVPSYGMICLARNITVEGHQEGFIVGCISDKQMLEEFQHYAGRESKFVQLASLGWINRPEKLIFYWENGSGWKLKWETTEGGENSPKPEPESLTLSFELTDGRLCVWSRPLPTGIQNLSAYILGIGALLCLVLIISSWRQLIGQLEELNFKLKQKAKEAEEASQAKSHYISYISHEIRTPLTYILGYAQMLAEDPLIPEGKRYFLRSIVQGGELVTKIINDVLDIAKVEAGAMELKLEPFSVKTCLQEVEHTVKLGAVQKGVRLDFINHSSEDVWVIGDKLKCQQIIMNFLSNAIKVTPQGGIVKLEIRTEETKDDNKISLLVDIHDSGPGLSPDEQKNLFLPFYQTRKGTQIGGTGLGLYFAYKLAELMGGKVSVESEIGKGTVIHFQIEMDRANRPQEELSAKEQLLFPEHPSIPPLRVIVCDDDPGTRELFKTWLKNINLNVEEAEDGKNLFKKLLAFKPHAVILDMVLPDIDGVAAIEKIRNNEQWKTVKVISVTGKAYEDYEERAIKVGADAFMLKPVDQKGLLNTLLKLCKVETGEKSSSVEGEIPETIIEELKQFIFRADIQGFTRKLKSYSSILGGELTGALLNLAKDYHYSEIIEILDKAFNKDSKRIETDGNGQSQHTPG